MKRIYLLFKNWWTTNRIRRALNSKVYDRRAARWSRIQNRYIATNYTYDPSLPKNKPKKTVEHSSVINKTEYDNGLNDVFVATAIISGLSSSDNNSYGDYTPSSDSWSGSGGDFSGGGSSDSW